MEVKPVMIIGAGPAGLATTIQLKRYGVEPLIFERQAIGGLLRNANLVENYPGFPEGISGVELAHLFEQQAARIGVRVIYEEVLQLDFNDGTFVAQTSKGRYTSRVAVIASGTKPRRFTDFDIPAAVSERIYYEVYPLLQETGKTIAIVGAGDAAFDYALNLARANRVLLLNRGADRRCLGLLWERASRSPAIQYLENITISAVEAGPYQMLHLECCASGQGMTLEVDYLIGALGREAQADYLTQGVREQAQALEERGVFYLVGDVRRGIYRQTSIAVGDGVLAAMKIFRTIQEVPL
jgi:thioredoxin reductase (NADPH)